MSDFLTRLAGRALRQTPVLEPLVASVHAPLDTTEAPAPDAEEVHRPARSAADPRPPPTVRRPDEARQVRVADLREPQLRSSPTVRPAATVQPPIIRRAVDTLAEVASTEAQQVVDTAEPVSAAPDVVVVNRASVNPADHAPTEDYQGEALSTSSEGIYAQVGGAPRERVVGQQTTVREEVGARAVDRIPPAAEEPTVRQRSVGQGPRAEEAAAPAGSNVVLRREEAAAPEPLTRRRHELPVPAAESPTITVSIGRIEVRAAPAEPHIPARAAAPRPGPRLSLDEYLAQRTRSQR